MAADIWDSSSERQVFIYIILSYASGSLNKLAGDIAYVTEERVLSGCRCIYNDSLDMDEDVTWQRDGASYYPEHLD